MDLKDIKKIVEMMKLNDLTEFDLQEEDFKICLKRKNEESQVVMAQPQQMMMPAQAAPAPAAGGPAAAAPAEAAPLGATIDSPMVGSFYRKPSPEADSFVQVGSSVDENTTVCIIEAMKVMNEIKAETKGVIKKILVDDTSPVEYGQPLFEIEPA